MIIFKATDKQLMQLCANAVNASKPIGLGKLHYIKDHVFKPEDFKDDVMNLQDGLVKRLELDYVEGRMVKLQIHYTRNKGEYMTLNNVQEDFQSWYKTYPTALELLQGAGIDV
jgi:hypothetical protein